MYVVAALIVGSALCKELFVGGDLGLQLVSAGTDVGQVAVAADAAELIKLAALHLVKLGLEILEEIQDLSAYLTLEVETLALTDCRALLKERL